MKKMNRVFAVIFIAIVVVALYGVFFRGAHGHVFTAFFAGFFALLFLADTEQVASK